MARALSMVPDTPPEARYHRAEADRGMLMDGVALEQARKRMRPDPTPAKASLALLPAQDGARPHRAVPQKDRQARQRLVGGATVESSSTTIFTHLTITTI